MNNILDYIDFTSICEDHNLETGDLSPMLTMVLTQALNQFIQQNK